MTFTLIFIYLTLSLATDNKILSMLLALESQMECLRASTETAIDTDVKFMAAASDLADRELVMTISWAKQVPGESLTRTNGSQVKVTCLLVWYIH